MISPPGSVCVSAVANERHGATIEHGLVSIPVDDTKVRWAAKASGGTPRLDAAKSKAKAWAANAGRQERVSMSTSRQTAGRSGDRPDRAYRAPRTGEAQLQGAGGARRFGG